MTDDLQALLRDLDMALEDWHIEHETPSYVQEILGYPTIAESRKRVNAAGGTLAYIAALRERIKRAQG